MRWDSQKVVVSIAVVTPNVSIIEFEAKKLGVRLAKPKSVEAFLEALKTLQAERRKAENVLLDDIE